MKASAVPKEVPVEDCVSFDESFDDAGWTSEDSVMDDADGANDQLMSSVTMRIQTMAVDLNCSPDRLPFFELPSLNQPRV